MSASHVMLQQDRNRQDPADSFYCCTTSGGTTQDHQKWTCHNFEMCTTQRDETVTKRAYLNATSVARR